MKTCITIIDNEIHIMVVNYETKKREDIRLSLMNHCENNIDALQSNHELIVETLIKMNLKASTK